MRNEARQQMRQANRLIAIRTPDMNVLSVHGELLGQITVQIGDKTVAIRWIDTLVFPMLEWMCAAAGKAKVQLVGGRNQQRAHRGQLRQHLLVIGMHGSSDLDHAFGDFRLDVVTVPGLVDDL
jgi:hypothetical protein